MRVLISVQGTSTGKSLRTWLQSHPGATAVTLESQASHSGEMGAGDVFQAVFTDATALAGLITAVGAWRRPIHGSDPTPRPPVALRRGATVRTLDGDGEGPVDVDAIADALAAASVEENSSEDGGRSGTAT